MFLLLSRVLLWLLLGAIVFSLFQRFYPSGSFVGRLVLVVLIVVVLLSFVNPSEPAIASLWRVISFPLKPLGASVLLMIVAAQKIKDGGIGKPGGYLMGWALTILLLASTPAVAYFIVRSPVASPTTFAPANDTLVAALPNSTAISDIRTPYYLMQNPTEDIPRRGLRLEDFVPNAQTLSLTTSTWESYLNQVYVFLRGRQQQ
ncbi:hypothetical protein [Calothrix sp. 336/3]|uniref:hypothetical protein n=1 Tax=Calothrix sp. 336/3 TaxID=1337936 RepID=UPI0004E3B137|nr:hypothetical protein [Calothrix sp. 336/3]AKG22759.1 hypothetical protein IJ00_17075 [Calothrix sp. 336/3]